MKILSACIYLSLVVLFCLPAPQIFAATWYVKPTAELPLRRGQGTGFKIIAVLGSGTPVTFLEENNGWARIRLNSGKEGWILKRYLGRETPLKDQVAQLEQTNSQLKQKLEKTDTRFTELMGVHNQTEKDLTACMAERDAIKKNFAQLQQDTADVVQTKKQLALTKKQLADQNKSVADLQLENTGLKKSSSLIWFIAGAGVLLIGWFIGFITGKRNKRRRSSLL